MKVYVVVVTYNGLHWINKCIESLFNSDISLHMLIIDNASTDGTSERIKTLFPEMDLIESKENLGFGKANNIGLIRAKEDDADYVFLLNQDAWVEPDTIRTLIEMSQLNPKFGVLSPLHMKGDGTGLDIAFSHYVSPGNCSELLSDFVVGRVSNVYETKFVNAAAWLLTKNCIDIVGGFDPIFPHYGEDVDYINRCLFHGFSVAIVPKVKIYHDRVYTPASKHEMDVKKVFVYNLTVLKAYPASFIFNFVLFLISQVNLFTCLLVLRDFAKIRVRLSALFMTLCKTSVIWKSKKFFLAKRSDILLKPDY